MIKQGKEKALQALGNCMGVVAEACKAAGVSRSAFYKWQKSDAAFAEAVEEIQAAQVDFVEGQLLQKIKEGDTTAIIFYLKTKGRGRGYGERVELAAEKPIEPITGVMVLPSLGRDEIEAGKKQRSIETK